MKKSKLIFTGLALALIILSSYNRSVISSSSVVGKWKVTDMKIKGIVLDSLTREQKSAYKKRMTEIKLHSIFIAKSDGSYHHVSWIGEEVINDGTWKLTPDGKNLILSGEKSVDTVGVIITGKKMEWNINGNKIYYKRQI